VLSLKNNNTLIYVHSYLHVIMLLLKIKWFVMKCFQPVSLQNWQCMIRKSPLCVYQFIFLTTNCLRLRAKLKDCHLMKSH